MFTGIIEALGTIEAVKEAGGNRIFEVSSPLSEHLKVDQSVSHNGVCLTVEAIAGNTYQVTAVAETLQKSNAGDWKAGTLVNL
ncbi:MAG: riboflavin synthase, partial [Chitinophagaceae bacterium]